MPIIGKAKIQTVDSRKRGVLVDSKGFFVSLVFWTGDKRPVINKKGTPKEERRRLITFDKNPKAENVPSKNARWDFETLDWVLPQDDFVLIKEDTGQVLRRFKGFREKLPECPEGCAMVDDPLPETRSFKPLYDKTKQAFVAPRRVALVDADGIVQNIVLENPNDTAPDVEVPEGWSRFDDRDWPVDADGDLIGQGHVKVGEEWKKKAVEESEV